MISLLIPPKDQINRFTSLLNTEYGTASNIKSRVNRLSVQGAITSAQHILKCHNKVPPNGLVIYTGMIFDSDGKEKKLSLDFEPFAPIGSSLYLCDNKFHTEQLEELCDDDDKYGFIIMDGSGCLLGILSGQHRQVLFHNSVELPKKHGRGGQSAPRFQRLRLEARQTYVTKTAEHCKHHFIDGDKLIVRGIVVAGNADLKNRLRDSQALDHRIRVI